MPDNPCTAITKKAVLALLLSLAPCLLLAGCDGRDLLISGAGSVASGSMQRRGISGTMSDYHLRMAVNEALFHHSVDLYREVSLLVSGGRVVLLGRVPTAAAAAQAGQLARQAGATQMANRLSVDEVLGSARVLEDKTLTLRLESELTFDRDVKSLNYELQTVDGVVYVIGEASGRRERRRVLHVLSHFPGVRRVESYILLPGEPGE